CEDYCSICLKYVCDNDPKMVTCCKHEFHFQCILEMVPYTSLEAVMKERLVRHNPTRNSTIFHHPTLGDYEIRNVPVGFSTSEFADRIVQHLAAATAIMGRAHHASQRNHVSVGQSQYGATVSAEPVAELAADTVQHVTTSGKVNGSNSQHETSVIHVTFVIFVFVIPDGITGLFSQSCLLVVTHALDLILHLITFLA
ncbi:E3 ubiquitin-protein ligase RHF2A-like, partial [Bidens hawaiensis]|uniref:E3 ubiquitin-protein ligase RHF2A-like n=1 Tax=Bidens hawaiensis TaxID=980011 RepID=UPI00404B469E